MERIICSRCGADNTTKAKYCSSCGYELPQIQLENSIDNSNVIKNKSKSNKIRKSYIFGIIVFALASFAVKQFLFKPPSIDETLVKISNEYNKNCPIMIDQETRLDNIVVLPDKVIQYNYTLINIDKDSVNVKEIENYLKPNILNNIKTNPDLKQYRDKEVTMSYYYKDRSSVFLTKITITPEQYKE